MKTSSSLSDWLHALGRRTRPALAWNARTVAGHRAWRARFRRKLKELLGRTPEPAPLKTEWAETRETDAFTRRKVYIRAEKDYWIPAYYFVPKSLKKKAPAIV